MIKNYFKVAWRNLFRNRTLSFINIFGLSLGMAFAMLIGMWVHFERNFDRFNKNVDRIAVVEMNVLFNGQKSTTIAGMLPLYDALKTNYPEIKRASRLQGGNGRSLMAGTNKFKKNGYYVDPDFLKMFTFPAVKGNPETALNDPNSIVLTESLASALFGRQDPIGKTVKIDNQFDVRVSAVIQDPPNNSSISFDFLGPFEFQLKHAGWLKDATDNWGTSFLANLVEIKEGASMEGLSQKIGPLLMQKNIGEKNKTLFLHPLAKWRLYDNYENWVNAGGRIEYLRLFALIGCFVLLIACINFMNLSTARSEKRAKEVGIRKTLGSRRVQLIGQFMTESMLTTFLAFLLSLVLIKVLLPYLRDVGFGDIRFDLSNAALGTSMLAVCVITGMVAGSYPALYLSSFRPVKVLKGIIKQGSDAVSFRKVLVVSQFAISIGLVISTVIVFQQIRHAQRRSIGYNPDNLITVAASYDLIKNYTALKQDLLNTGYVETFAQSSSSMTYVNNDWSDFTWEGKDPNANIDFDVVTTGWDYEKAAGLEFVAGRPFSREYKTDSDGVILNEAALNMIGYKDPVGKTIRFNDRVLTIVGVTKNVVMRDPFKPVPPGVILFGTGNTNELLIRLSSRADVRKSLAAIQPIVEKYNPAFPFEYSFVNKEFAKKFATENQVAKLASLFAGLAIFISCLGLYGLAMFMAERRAKEISIRKVLGASVSHLWLLLSKEFVWLVLIAWLVASPLAFWLMKEWLGKYEYRINIDWSIFLLAGSLAIVIALLTVSAQSIRTAIADPVKGLKQE